MEVQVLSSTFQWGPDGVAHLHELCRDWHGDQLSPPTRYQLVQDPSHLWLLASRESPANPHPTSNCGDFQANLWRYDVAELFIASPQGEGYLEFNLSPRGAWWVARFGAPRQPDPLIELPQVIAHSQCTEADWLSALGIPLDWLCSTIAWGAESKLNVTFIVDSPTQRFLSAAKLGGGEPDFHRPASFPRVERRDANTA